jgi:radical SAM protein with 4Fe4S-binding SPASM domain
LQYLLMHITTRCNLTCSHCYLGDVEPLDLPLDSIVRAMEEFDEMQGLRLLVSGGEPLLHPQFWDLNELFPEFSFRTAILSNGTLFANSESAKRLRAHEAQVSLDGVKASHDSIRGAGNYEKSLNGLHKLVDAGIDVSVATMIHADNQDDFEELEAVVHGLDAREWSIDVPARTGRWAHNHAGEVDPEKIGPILARAFGGGSHFSADGDWACGAHLCAVMADGAICKCGFYADSPVGELNDGLAHGWMRIPRLRTSDLRCDCDIVSDCRGGCRYRAQLAGDPLGKDPILCMANGLPC